MIKKFTKSGLFLLPCQVIITSLWLCVLLSSPDPLHTFSDLVTFGYLFIIDLTKKSLMMPQCYLLIKLSLTFHILLLIILPSNWFCPPNHLSFYSFTPSTPHPLVFIAPTWFFAILTLCPFTLPLRFYLPFLPTPMPFHSYSFCPSMPSLQVKFCTLLAGRRGGRPLIENHRSFSPCFN